MERKAYVQKDHREHHRQQRQQDPRFLREDLEQISKIEPFSGDWQGNGTDSAGNDFVFKAKVIHLGDNKYRVLILDKLGTFKKPIHIMDGVLENNQFPHTADEGLYEGGGTLREDTFEGYYKGPVDGTYKMWRIKDACENAPDNEYSDYKSEWGLDH